jgi:hypothetical protein
LDRSPAALDASAYESFENFEASIHEDKGEIHIVNTSTRRLNLVTIDYKIIFEGEPNISGKRDWGTWQPRETKMIPYKKPTRDQGTLQYFTFNGSATDLVKPKNLTLTYNWIRG